MDSAADLDTFVARGWEAHAKDAAGVFDRLPKGLPLVREPRHVAALAALATHVAAEHLGRFDEGISFLSRIERLPAFSASTPEGKSVRRSMGVLHYCAGRRADADTCLDRALTGGDVPEASDRIRLLAVAASALAGRRRIEDARAAFDEALRLASYGPGAQDPASKAIAITGNNLAVELESRESRTPAETQLMLRAAEAALTHWSISGGWLETERAHYRASSSHRRAGSFALAVHHAYRCREIVAANRGDPGEMFFAHEALAHALLAAGERAGAVSARDTAAGLLQKIADVGFRESATTDLAALDAALAAAR